MKLDGELYDARVAGGNDGGGRGIDDGHAPADRLHEDAAPLEFGWDRRDHRSSNRLSLALVVEKEKRPIVAERPAEHAAELLPIVNCGAVANAPVSNQRD